MLSQRGRAEEARAKLKQLFPALVAIKDALAAPLDEDPDGSISARRFQQLSSSRRALERLLVSLLFEDPR
jgi:hypothetical protein